MNEQPNIVIIGFMGAGKSTTARILAERLGRDLVELDDDVVALSGYPSVPAIFDAIGEEGFRKLEERACTASAGRSGLVISAGGGLVMRDSSMEAVSSAGAKVVYLRVEFDTVLARINDTSTRPLLRDIERARKLYELRSPLYTRWATTTVDVDKLSPDAVANAVIADIFQEHP